MKAKCEENDSEKTVLVEAETEQERKFLEDLQEEFTNANLHDVASMFKTGKIKIAVSETG